MATISAGPPAFVQEARVTAEPFLEPHVAGDVALHLIRRGRGVVLTLSRPQPRLLVAMADRPSSLSRAEVAAVLWAVAVTPPPGGNRSGGRSAPARRGRSGA
jgi:hypothetical protein